MSATTETTLARRLAQRRPEHPLISAFIDLDPSSFATAPARATEISSLLDDAHRQLNSIPLEHDDRVALEDDLVRVDRYLHRDLDASGARGFAVFCSRRAQLFETQPLKTPTHSTISIEPVPRLEPLLPAPEPAHVCITLINRRDARFLVRDRDDGSIDEETIEDHHVHGQHRQGGWSEANYERSVESDVDGHMRRSAEALYRLWQRRPFDRLVLGGPHEAVTRFTGELHPDLKRILESGAELSCDPGACSSADVEAALEPLRRRWREQAQEDALQAMLTRLDGRGGVATGTAATLAALDQRQVQTLILAPRVDDEGTICPLCEQIYTASEDVCPADGSFLTPILSLRDAMVRAAILQDADVIVLSDLADRPEVEAFGGVGARLRY